MTDRLRNVMQRARLHARTLNHEYLSTEHMLLGLLDDANGLACYALRELCDLGVLRTNLMSQMVTGEPMVTLGKPPFTPRLKKAVEAAMRYREHDLYMGPEHILVGLLEDPLSVAGVVMADIGVTQPKVLEILNALLDDNSDVKIETRHVLALMLRCQDALTQIAKQGTPDLQISLNALHDSVRWLSEWRLAKFADNEK
jgi:ATP-dependent Clp protease ATP-binding subunit ClpA